MFVLFCSLATVFLINGLSDAQQREKIWRIGYLDPSNPSITTDFLERFDKR
jgi:hypothetical protein